MERFNGGADHFVKDADGTNVEVERTGSEGLDEVSAKWVARFRA